jgi:hypothetical protein
MERRGQIAQFVPNVGAGAAQLEIVVPFTTVELTQVALKHVEQLAPNLACKVRILRFHVVPFGVAVDCPTVRVEHLERQLRSLETSLDCSRELLIGREAGWLLSQVLPNRSVIVIASRKRIWRTREKRFAQLCKRRGHTVLLVHEGHSC